VVLDLSDEPVLGPPERFALASRVLALGIPYEGSDFRFDPPPATVVDVPTLAVIGTGKRVGKTAVTGHVARRLASTRRTVVVAMGRGGPPEPEVVVVRPTVETLLELSRNGRHAASDHLETAIVAGVTTVGCRRCGGGLAGAVAVSNVLEGVSVAAGLGAELVVLDGSGAALPPVAADRRVLVASAAQPVEVTAGYLNSYRARIADLVVVTMAEDDAPHAELRDALRAHMRPWTPLVRTVLRPRPLEPVDGASVAFFCTAPPERHPPLAEHLEAAHGARVTSVSGNLSDRVRLYEDLAIADADVFLVELKAAAVDVVVEEASRRGVRVVVAANDIVPLPGESILDEALERLAAEAVAPAREPVRSR
jgi:cyclic 2,3-diphosphoglycerate synthetase